MDESGARPQVVGVAEHLDDAELQQFVNAKTQRPVSFSYRAVEIEGKSVGVIEIPVQPRPVYLLKDYGRVRANVVYLRRGSSTAEAAPEEIARMGEAKSRLSAGDLRLLFAEAEARKTIGESAEIQCTVLRMKEHVIPDFAPPGAVFPYVQLESPNVDFYRELVAGAQKVNLLSKVALTLRNDGAAMAGDIRVELTLDDPDRIWEFCDEHDYPQDIPERFHGPGMLRTPNLRFNRKGEPTVETEYLDGKWHISLEVPQLQPGRTLWPALVFCAGARRSSAVTLSGRILANCLSSPVSCALELEAEVEESSMSLGELEKRLAG